MTPPANWLARVASVPLHPFLFGTLFVVYLLGENLGDEVQLGHVRDALALVLAAVAACFVAFLLATRRPRLAGVLTSIVTLWFFGFGEARAVLTGGGPADSLLPIWVGAGLLALVLAWIFNARAVAATNLLNVIAAAVVAFNVAPAVPHYVSTATTAAYEPPAAATFEGVPTETADYRPDIFYIVLDRYPSAETLSGTAYDYDNGPFIEELERRGFYVAHRSRANYITTALSVASSLNMDYLDVSAMAAAASDPGDWKPVYDMLAGRLAVPTLLEQQGYTYIQLPSWFDPTAAGAEVDLRYRHPSFSAFGDALYRSTVAPALMETLGIGPVEQPHVANALFQFERLANLEDERSPKFVFAHILLPHPPIVFGPDGPLPPLEYAYEDVPPLKFIGQLEYTNRRVLELLDELLTSSDSNDPVVIIQADEGPHTPTAVDDWRNARPEQYQRKFGILNAFYLPGVPTTDLYPTITPVNGFRVIFNSYFGALMPLLDDRVYAYRDDAHIYENIDITDRFARSAEVAIDAGAATYEAEPPVAWTAGVPQSYDVTVVNSGLTTWEATGTNAVELWVRFEGGPETAWVRERRFALPNAVLPGETTTVRVEVTPPDVAGTYQMRHQLARGSTWLQSGPAHPVDVMSSPEIWADVLDAGYDVDAPTAWTAGETSTYRVEVKNRGPYTWNSSSEFPVTLGVHFGGESDEVGAGWVTNVHVPLTADVAPGQSASVDVSVEAPTAPGTYTLRHRMVKEEVAWFDEISVTTVEVVPNPASGRTIVAIIALLMGLVVALYVGSAAALRRKRA